MSVIQRTAFDSSKFKQKIKTFPNDGQKQSRGPIKASYELPTRQWQMKYQFKSPSKSVQSSNKRSLNNAEESSEYGTMENVDNMIPQLNIADDGSSFNDISIEERRERISCIMDEILSIPRLAEANITQRSLSRSSMTRFTGGGSVRSTSSQMSSKMKNNVSSRQSNQTKHFPHQTLQNGKQTLLRRTVSSPKLNGNNRPGNKLGPGGGQTKINQPREAGAAKKKSGSISKLNLALDLSSQSSELDHRIRDNNRQEDELSSEFLPRHDVSSMRPTLGNDTRAELVLSVPTLGDDTELGHDEDADTFDAEKTTDFVRANMRISPKKLQPVSGRNSAASSVMSVKHRAGAVPRYLRTRQAEWAEAAAQALASIPDPDCPPGHVRLPEESRTNLITQYSAQHAAMLHELNRLPVSSDTRRVVTRRKELESQLGVLEEEIRNFSRPKVFLPPDVLQEILRNNNTDA